MELLYPPRKTGLAVKLYRCFLEKERLSVVRKLGSLGVLIFIVLSCREPGEVSGLKQIISFALSKVKTVSVSIDETSGVISIIVPYGTVLADLNPEISISPDASIVPLPSVSQNFGKQVYYTVTALDGSKKVYTISVTSQKQGAAQITGFSKDTIRAGGTLLVSGKDFGSFGAGIQVVFKSVSGNEISIPSKLLDSTRLSLVIPAATSPDSYFIKVIKNKIETVSARMLLVKIPPPEITSVKFKNILQGDSIYIAGSFITPAHYDYRLELRADQRRFTLDPVKKETGKLSFITDAKLPPGSYSLYLVNVHEQVTGIAATENIRIYDNQLPFIKGIADSKTAYKPTETVLMYADKFDKLTTRFYQVELTGNGVKYNQNGIYSAADKRLSIVLPADMKASRYTVKVIFLTGSAGEVYNQDLDDTLTITQ